jgi:hypothetical protein
MKTKIQNLTAKTLDTDFTDFTDSSLILLHEIRV